jgi:oligogalacturonide lyase
MLQSFALLPDERGLCYVDSPALLTTLFSTLRPREVYRAPSGFLLSAMSVSSDGLYAPVIENKGAQHRLKLVDLRSATAATLADAEAEELTDPVPRPRRASVLYRRGAGQVWLANYDGKQNYRLRIAAGQIPFATWSRDGRSVLYINIPEQPGKPNSIREFVPDSNEDRHVADTTQFSSFDSNGDGSMFVGASASKASPYILLLARKVKREFTLCEHTLASTPVFSPNSQQVFFSSQQHGQPAIYQMDVGKIVEETKDADP